MRYFAKDWGRGGKDFSEIVIKVWQSATIELRESCMLAEEGLAEVSGLLVKFLWRLGPSRLRILGGTGVDIKTYLAGEADNVCCRDGLTKRKSQDLLALAVTLLACKYADMLKATRQSQQSNWLYRQSYVETMIRKGDR